MKKPSFIKFVIAVMTFLPALSAHPQSTNFSAATPWFAYYLLPGPDCCSDPDVQLVYSNYINRYYSSPADAMNKVSAAVNEPIVSLTLTDYSPPSTVNFLGEIGPLSAPCSCGNGGYSDMVFRIDYAGTNYGQICADGTYVEGGQQCACECSAEYKGLGSSCDISGQCDVGNPISLAFGNKYEEITDYQTTGDNPLVFTRFYNSLGNTNANAHTLGAKWRSTYDRYLRIIFANGAPTTVVAERADGQELVFTASGTNWTTDTDVDLKLIRSGGVWTLSDPSDTVETYSSASSGIGVLTSIRYRDGNEQSLLYSSGLLLSVTDSFNRSLNFQYQNGLLYTMTTPSRLMVTYGYNSSAPAAMLQSASFSTSPATSQQYVYEDANNPLALTGLIDENGNRFASWTYDSKGRATSSQHAGGAGLTTISYNDSDGSRVVTNALEGVSIYKFQTLQGIPKIVEIDRVASSTVPAATRSFSYDGNGYLAFESDWNTNFLNRVNDNHGQPTSITRAASSPLAATTAITYLTNFHLPTLIVAPRRTTGIMYNTNGNPLSITQTDTSGVTVPYSTTGNTRTWTNTFDSFGHVLTITGPRTDVTATTSFVYDGSNDLVTVTDAMSHVTQLTNFTGSGLPLTMIDPNGVTNIFTYDGRDRLLTRAVLAASGNATNSFAYDPAGNITRITLADGSYLAYQYDDAHRLQSVSNALNEVVTFRRDAAGDITNRILTGANVITKTQNAVFDQLGRMLQQIGAASQTTSYGHDGDGNVTAITDGLTNKTARAFDALNRLSTTLDPLQNTTRYGYDPQNNLVSVTDPRQFITSYVYNGFGQVIQESSPDKGRTVYLLDLAGNRTNETDARGIVTVRTFDALNRVTSETFPASPGENIIYSYDATNNGNFGIGRLTGFTDETGSTSLINNERGDVVSTTRTIGGTAYTTGYAYDLADHITAITYPSGHVITYGRDSQGRINSVTYQPSANGTVTELAVDVTYWPFGPLSGFAYGNGFTRTQIYDQDYRLTDITTAGTSSVQNLVLGYDQTNNITSIADQLASPYNQHFTYDQDYRLTQATGIYGPVSYTYDADGNRLTRTFGGVTQNYTYASGSNALQSVSVAGGTRSFTYTPVGNLASDGQSDASLLLSYGNRNRYRSLTAGATTASYEYNARGERLVKTVNGVTTHFHYDETGHLIAESQPDGTLIREYVWLDDMPLAQVEANGAIYYIHPDQLGRPQKMTDTTGAVVWDNEEQPFGEALPLDAANPGFNTNGLFQMTASGGPNASFVVQAASDLTGPWHSISTNTTPFQFADSGATNLSRRFYRVLSIPSANSVTNNLRFPGQYYDAESGLNYNYMRDYDPTLGRYIQSDLIGILGGVNLYSYANASPVLLADRTGLDSGTLRAVPIDPISRPFNPGEQQGTVIPSPILALPFLLPLLSECHFGGDDKDQPPNQNPAASQNSPEPGPPVNEIPLPPDWLKYDMQSASEKQLGNMNPNSDPGTPMQPNSNFKMPPYRGTQPKPYVPGAPDEDWEP